MNNCRQYTKKITIENPSTTATADAHGFIDMTAPANWSEYCDAYARVITKGGKSFWKIDTNHEEVAAVFYCQYSATLLGADATMRLTCEGVTYEIVSVVDVDLARREIEIQTKEVT